MHAQPCRLPVDRPALLAKARAVLAGCLPVAAALAATAPLRCHWRHALCRVALKAHPLMASAVTLPHVACNGRGDACPRALAALAAVAATPGTAAVPTRVLRRLRGGQHFDALGCAGAVRHGSKLTHDCCRCATA